MLKNTNKFRQEPLVSRREAADMVSVTPKTIREYERKGLLTPIRLNCRVIRYERQELERLIAKCSSAPQRGQS